MEKMIFPLAIFVFIMLVIGIGLTIYEFRHFVITDEKGEDARNKIDD